eukprot:IDg4907t1
MADRAYSLLVCPVIKKQNGALLVWEWIKVFNELCKLLLSFNRSAFQACRAIPFSSRCAAARIRYCVHEHIFRAASAGKVRQITMLTDCAEIETRASVKIGSISLLPLLQLHVNCPPHRLTAVIELKQRLTPSTSEQRMQYIICLLHFKR